MSRLMLKLLTQLTMMVVLGGCGGGGSGALQGDPTPVAVLVVSGGSIFNFGSHALNTSTQQLFTISNVGAVPARQLTSSFYVSINFSFEGGSFPGTQGNCLSNLDPGSSCTISVVFSPQAMGLAQSTLQLSYDNGSMTVLNSQPILIGTGI